MASDSIFLRVSYPGYQEETLDKTLTKLALSYDGHWVAQGQSLIAPLKRDIEFEFSNKSRLEQFTSELQEKYSWAMVTLLGQEGDLDKELAWDIGIEEHS